MMLTLRLSKLIQALDLVTDAALELNRLATNTDPTFCDSRSIDRTSTLDDHAMTQVLELSLGEHGLHTNLLASDTFDPSMCR